MASFAAGNGMLDTASALGQLTARESAAGSVFAVTNGQPT
jgi:hypothetical protein